jgi:hypothetical protein
MDNFDDATARPLDGQPGWMTATVPVAPGETAKFLRLEVSE